MKRISEQQIETFVRFPGDLGRPEKERIKQALSESAELRELADFFENFYAEVDQVPSNTYTIELTPLSYAARKPTTSRLRLAAMGGGVKDREITTVALLTSESDQTLVRVLEDKTAGDYRFHIMSNRLGPEEIAIVTIDELNADFVIGSDRHLNIEPDSAMRNLDWSSTSVRFRLPVGSTNVSVNNSNTEGDQRQIGPYKLNIQIQKEQLKGTVHKVVDVVPSLSRVIVSGKRTGLKLVTVAENEFECSFDRRDRELDLLVYQ